jgi:hypothetical protein
MARLTDLGCSRRGPRTPKKTGRSIRRPARIRPLSKSLNRFRAFRQADPAPALMPPYLTMPVPSVSPIAMRMRPLSVGRIESAFHPAINHPIVILILCKEKSQVGSCKRGWNILQAHRPAANPHPCPTYVKAGVGSCGHSPLLFVERASQGRAFVL